MSKRADKDLLSMEQKDRQRVQEAIDRLLLGIGTANVVKIKTREEQWRLRVGDWRILFEIDNAEGLILVHRIMHRREAYR
ncbi:MAG: type II toxin-antitoxin system RelE/ParE family toxin [Deltaproteobacteria bacterium]|nr:type II toxin-antitoxin system RelE/ParE family toxin [Deltaproteobacteria bacterium]MDA8308330.1 type II toxin-antitoxin system RelE/ParE family toxin [Deltaproteobacteria bacterium]